LLGERAGVDALDAEDFVFFEVVRERLLGAPVGGDRREFTDDKGAGVNGRGFGVFGVNAVVADFWVGESDELTAVGGIGEDFLIACHGGVEADFSRRGSGVSKGEASINGAVFKG